MCSIQTRNRSTITDNGIKLQLIKTLPNNRRVQAPRRHRHVSGVIVTFSQRKELLVNYHCLN